MKKDSLDFRLDFYSVLETDSRCRMSKSFHQSLSIMSINISISTTACKSLQIISAGVQLVGTLASEMGDIINLVSDIINLEAEDRSANANQFPRLPDDGGWDGVYSCSQYSPIFISLAQMCM